MLASQKRYYENYSLHIGMHYYCALSELCAQFIVRISALQVFETVPSFLGEHRVILGCISDRHPRGFRLRVPGKPSNPDIRLPDPAWAPRPRLTPHNVIADYDTLLETSSQITSRNRRGFTGSYVRSRPVYRIYGHVRICKYGSTLNWPNNCYELPSEYLIFSEVR